MPSSKFVGSQENSSTAGFRSYYQNDGYYAQHEDSSSLRNATNSNSGSAVLSSSKTAVTANNSMFPDLVNSRWIKDSKQQRLNTNHQPLGISRPEDDQSSKVFLTGLDGLGTNDIEQFLREHTSQFKPTNITWCDEKSAIIAYRNPSAAIEALKLLSTGAKSRGKNYFEFRLAQPYGKDRLRPINVRLALRGDFEKIMAKLERNELNKHTIDPPAVSNTTFKGNAEPHVNAIGKDRTMQSGTSHDIPAEGYVQPEVPKVQFDFRSEEHSANTMQAARSASAPTKPITSNRAELFSVPPPASGKTEWEANRSIRVSYGREQPKSQGPSARPLFILPESLRGPPKGEASKNVSHASGGEAISPDSNSDTAFTKPQPHDQSTNDLSVESPAAREDLPLAKETTTPGSSVFRKDNDSSSSTKEQEEKPSKRGPLFALPTSLAMAGPSQPFSSRPSPIMERETPQLGPDTLAWDSRNKRRLEYLNTRHPSEPDTTWQWNSAPNSDSDLSQRQGHQQDQEKLVHSKPASITASPDPQPDGFSKGDVPNETPKAKPAILIAEAVKRWSQTRTGPSSPTANTVLREPSRSPLSFKQQPSQSRLSEQEEWSDPNVVKKEKDKQSHNSETRQADGKSDPSFHGEVELQSDRVQSLPLRPNHLASSQKDTSEAKEINAAAQSSEKVSSFEWSFDEDTANTSSNPVSNFASSSLNQGKRQQGNESILFNASNDQTKSLEASILDSPVKESITEKSQPFSKNPDYLKTPPDGKSSAKATSRFGSSPPSSGKNLRPDVPPFFPGPVPSPNSRAPEETTVSRLNLNLSGAGQNRPGVNSSHLDRLMIQVTSLEAQLKILRDEITSIRSEGAGHDNGN